MGIIDKFTGLMPRGHQRADLAPVGGEVLALRDDLDRWLERFFDEPWGLAAAADFRAMPRVNVDDVGDAIIVSVDVPGYDRDELALTVTPEALTIEGEHRRTSRDQGGGHSVAEERYERFTELVPLPPGVDSDRAAATVRNGRLTVRFPKVTPGSRGRRVQIQT